MNFKRVILALIALSFASPAAAAPYERGETFVSRTELVSETSAPLTRADAAAFFAGPGTEGRPLVIPAALIIMAGAKVWSVIADNRPSANLASAYASAIPGFSFNWDDMAGWRKVTRKYRFTIDTWLQGRPVDILYEVSFFHGALAAPGAGPGEKGHYMVNFVIKPEVINLKWGWKVSLDAAMSDPMNIGTAEEPVAMLNADLKWRYAKPLSTDPEIGMNSLSVDGLGNVTEQAYGELNVAPVPVPEPDLPAAKVAWD